MLSFVFRCVEHTLLKWRCVDLVPQPLGLAFRLVDRESANLVIDCEKNVV